VTPTVLRDPGVGRTLEEYYVEVNEGLRIKMRIAEVRKEDGSTEYCCFADEPPLTDLERQIYTEASRKIGHLKDLRNRKREEVYLLLKANLRKAAS
jgi:hypothetical protein